MPPVPASVFSFRYLQIKRKRTLVSPVPKYPGGITTGEPKGKSVQIVCAGLLDIAAVPCSVQPAPSQLSVALPALGLLFAMLTVRAAAGRVVAAGPSRLKSTEFRLVKANSF